MGTTITSDATVGASSSTMYLKRKGTCTFSICRAQPESGGVASRKRILDRRRVPWPRRATIMHRLHAPAAPRDPSTQTLSQMQTSRSTFTAGSLSGHTYEESSLITPHSRFFCKQTFVFGRGHPDCACRPVQRPPPPSFPAVWTATGESHGTLWSDARQGTRSEPAANVRLAALRDAPRSTRRTGQCC
jgi:hypothetical protein